MTKYVAAVIMTAVVLAAAGSAEAATKFVVSLDSSQETGAVTDPVGATGQGSLTLVDLGGGDFSWEYEVTISPELDFSTVTGMPGLANGGRAVTGFHIHGAPRDVNGGIDYGLFGPSHDTAGGVMAVLNPDNSTTFSGAWGPADGNASGPNDGDINAIAVADLLPASPGEDVPFYFNIHTAPINPGGEIRGQIVAIPEPAAALLCLLGGLAMLAVRRR